MNLSQNFFDENILHLQALFSVHVKKKKICSIQIHFVALDPHSFSGVLDPDSFSGVLYPDFFSLLYGSFYCSLES